MKPIEELKGAVDSLRVDTIVSVQADLISTRTEALAAANEADKTLRAALDELDRLRGAEERIFVVSGQCGEYSDHREWMVAAYPTQALADEHKQRAQAWMDENRERAYDQEFSSPWDPNAQVSYTGTDYFVSELKLLRALPLTTETKESR